MTRKDRTRNEYVRGTNGIALIVDKMRWFGRVIR